MPKSTLKLLLPIHNPVILFFISPEIAHVCVSFFLFFKGGGGGGGGGGQATQIETEKKRENYLGVYVVQRPLKTKLSYLCTSNAERRQNSKLMIESLFTRTQCMEVFNKFVLKLRLCTCGF
jgi:hypothetical protein